MVLVSSADETAFGVRSTLITTDTLREGAPVSPVFLSSGDIEEFARIGAMLLGPELVDVGQWLAPGDDPKE